MKQAAVQNILAVFQGWKCNGLNLSRDSEDVLTLWHNLGH